MGLWVVMISSILCTGFGLLLCADASCADPMNATASRVVFNVKKFGAKGDGRADDSKALLKAWISACASSGRPRIVIPHGTFLSGPVKFVGPCPSASKIIMQVNGKIIAPTDLTQFTSRDWISFRYIDGLVLTGGGVFDRRGASAWPANDCNKSSKCKQLPLSLTFNFITNSTIRRISSVDSKNTHMLIFASNNVYAYDLKIVAPSDSPNTDGIHVSESNGIHISRARIATGDDCIAILPGSNQVSISKVFCGPGHGISLRTQKSVLGRYQGQKDVTGLILRNSTFTETQNGLRIKTWPGPGALSAKNFTFEDIVMNNVSNPIVIDQQYCPNNACPNKGEPSEVKIIDVNFINVKGTSASPVAVKLVCSEKFPCQVKLKNIDLKYAGCEGKTTTSICENVEGFSIGTQIPPSCI